MRSGDGNGTALLSRRTLPASRGSMRDEKGPGAEEMASTEQARQAVLATIEEKMRKEGKPEDSRMNYASMSGGGVSGDMPYYIHPWKDPAFGPPVEYQSLRPFPPAILRTYSLLQAMSFQGLWTEIHRAWITVDNLLYIWDYHTEGKV
ncbi:nuclear pore complex protein [Nannochloropsis gaditana]|uniref:Nuclear pore complex protein n=1 Tax=Nannochloropsis gaditana TaxID=72520 RepID=W7U2G5_9STRA|nr:nuclear pore complex protein [Nannochloropsis gaditana]